MSNSHAILWVVDAVCVCAHCSGKNSTRPKTLCRIWKNDNLNSYSTCVVFRDYSRVQSVRDVSFDGQKPGELPVTRFETSRRKRVGCFRVRRVDRRLIVLGDARRTRRKYGKFELFRNNKTNATNNIVIVASPRPSTADTRHVQHRSYSAGRRPYASFEPDVKICYWICSFSGNKRTFLLNVPSYFCGNSIRPV